MSRWQVPGIDPATEVYLGWDRSLATYFAQAYDRREPVHRQILLWVGTRFQEILTIDDLACAMRDVAILHPETRRMLYRDRDLEQGR